MRLTKGKILTLIALLIILVAGITIPISINSYIRNRINLNSIKSGVIQTVKSQTGLDMRVQNVSYRFLQGIVFTGVKFYGPDARGPDDFLVRTESFLLKISLYNALRKNHPFSEVNIPEGKINPWILSSTEWSDLFKKFAGYNQANAPKNPIEIKTAESETVPPEENRVREIFNDISINIERLNIQVPEYIKTRRRNQSFYNKLYLDLSLSAGVGRFLLRTYIDTGAEEPPQVNVRGKWKNQDNRRLNFKFKNIPAPFVADISQELTLLSLELNALLKKLRITSGILEGQGSLDTFKEGSGVNVVGTYLDLNAHTDESPAAAVLRLVRSGGKFGYNSAFEKFSEGPVHTTWFMKQENLDFNISYSNLPETRARKGKRRMEIKARVNLKRLPESREQTDAPDNPRLQNAPVFSPPGVRTSGQALLELEYNYGKKWIEPRFRLELSDLYLYPQTDIFNHNNNPRPAFILEKGGIAQKPGAPLDINIDGKYNQARFKLTGGGPAAFSYKPGPRATLPILKQKLKLDFDVDGLSYRDLIIPLSRMNGLITRNGTAHDAPRAEDQGQLLRYKYISPEREEALMNNTYLELRLRLKNLREGGADWPRSLQARIVKKESRYFEMEMSPVKTDNFEMEFEYTILFVKPLPAHRMKFEASIKGNPIGLPELLDSDKPPLNIKLKYDLHKASGWLPYDLINRSYSRFTMEFEGIDVNELTPVKIMKHKLELPREAFYADRAKITRVTNGHKVKYDTLSFSSRHVSLSGRGEYIPGEGGEVRFKYKTKSGENGKGESDKFTLLIREDDKWFPDSDF